MLDIAIISQTLGRAEFLDELRRILADAERAIAASDPACESCGQCCDFTRMDHRLYVSTGELALLCSQPAPRPAKLWRCPYQIDKKCLARRDRPLGCRVFFCRSPLEEDFYEQFHRKIVQLHRQFSVPYFYTELTGALLTLSDSHSLGVGG